MFGSPGWSLWKIPWLGSRERGFGLGIGPREESENARRLRRSDVEEGCESLERDLVLGRRRRMAWRRLEGEMIWKEEKE